MIHFDLGQNTSSRLLRFFLRAELRCFLSREYLERFFDSAQRICKQGSFESAIRLFIHSRDCLPGILCFLGSISIVFLLMTYNWDDA